VLINGLRAARLKPGEETLARGNDSLPRAMAPNVAEIKTLAVLPFQPLDDGARDEATDLGMADALITRLSTLRHLVVRPTGAVRKYRDPKLDPLSAGREQQVDAVLAAHYHREGQRMRVTAQLLRTSDGRPLWSGKFDEQSSDRFALEDSISERLATALAPQLTSEEKQRLTYRYTNDAEAYDRYQQGRYHLGKRNTEGLRRGVEYFEQATRKDASFAAALAGLAGGYALMNVYNLLPPKEVYPKAREAAERALVLDETLAEAHAVRGFIAYRYEWNWGEAERHFKRAIELNPGSSMAHHWYGEYLVTMGRFDEGIAELQAALKIDPLSLIINSDLGWELYLARRHEESIAQLRRTLDLEADFRAALYYVIDPYEQQKRYEDALAAWLKYLSVTDEYSTGPGGGTHLMAAAKRAYAASGYSGVLRERLKLTLERRKRSYQSPVEVANIYAALGEKEQALAWLEKAYQERSADLAFIKVYPAYDVLRTEAGFTELLRRLGLTR
jgi:TolB-like protein